MIKFGTSGWRGIIGEDFTFDNVRIASQGIANYLKKANQKGRGVVIAYDTRFLSEKFASEAARILAFNDIQAYLCTRDVPTPCASFETIRRKAMGAINFTASHNPPEYNGIKFSTPDGAPALPEATERIEAEIEAYDAGRSANLQKTAPASQPLEPKAMYLARLKEIVDFPAIKKAGLRIGFDPFWGAARGYSDSLLRDSGVDTFTVHDIRDVMFGGHAPEPDDHLLEELRTGMKEKKAHIGIATDGDADRFGIVDEDGTFMQPNYIIALLFDYLVESRGWKNGVGKSVATTNLINTLAKHHKIELHETPVGFKYIGELIKADKIVIGGEESAGLSIRHHVPEKDGVIAGLLCCEAVACRGKSLGQQLKELFVKVGSFYPQRDNFRLTEEVKAKFTEKLRQEPKDFYGRKVSEIVRTDGLKLIFADNSWLCYRLSGTEPVVRVYSEAGSPSELGKLSSAAKQWIFD